MWICIAVFLLWMKSGECTERANTSLEVEYTAHDFYEKLNSGKMMFIYFEQKFSPTISLFLVELELSAAVLQDYGVLVGKVNCNKELVDTYCTDRRMLHSAFLFRGGKEFLRLDLETIFDVHSIVSEVLFAILREEVKYVHTDSDLLAMEKAAKGQKNIVLGYVRSLGTQEHRSIMETAYVYGSKYQFILITGGPVLKHLGVNVSSYSSQVWFLHCRLHRGFMTPVVSERCPLTRMRKPLSVLCLHSFLQLMEAPLVSEVYEEPSKIPPAQFPYQHTPQVFLFSHPATAHLDRDMATALAWKLRGLALVLLVHSQSPSARTSDEYNAAYRLPERGLEVRYLTLHNPDEVMELFTHQEKDRQEDGDEKEDEVTFEEESDFGTLDDEIAAAVHKNRGSPLDMDSITQLTSDNFYSLVAQSSLTVVLFYVKWDAVSIYFLNAFVEVAERLEDSEVKDVQMSSVDCGEWTDLCAAQTESSLPSLFKPITAFPTILVFRPQESASHYRGMLGSNALHRFIMLSCSNSPTVLSSKEQATSFLQEVPHAKFAGYNPDRVLGVFQRHTQADVDVFTEAAKLLRGEVLTALMTDGLAEKWATDHTLDLPAVLAFPSWQTHGRPSLLPVSSSAKELLTHIHRALLHPMPELTVENLPSFLSLGKALLLLFVGEEEDEVGQRQNRVLVEEMERVLELGGGRMERYLPCWIHLGRTPAGMSVLGSYLGSMPPLPALVLAHLPTGDEIYQYPPNTPVVAESVLQWLQKIEDKAESPAGILAEDTWPPAYKFYDFLRIMDTEEPDASQQQLHEEDEEEEEEQAEREIEEVEDSLSVEEVTETSSVSSGAKPDSHSEL